MISSIALVVVTIGILITVHEFGHLLMAKLARIPVEVFSVGFGPVLLRKQVRETEYRLALIPLGGYIKMAGEDKPVAGGFLDRPAGIRIAVIAAGPFFNLLLGFVLIFVMFAVFGTTYFAPIVAPAPNSAAAAAGFQFGDVVETADGIPVLDFEQLETILYRQPPRPIEITVRRGNERLTLSWTTTPDTWLGPTAAVVEAVRPSSPAESAGIMPGDTIIAVDGRQVKRWSDVGTFIRSSRNRRVEITWRRAGETIVDSLVPAAAIDPATAEKTRQIGVSIQLPPRQLRPLILPVVGRVRRGSPAEHAGLRVGDTLIAVEDEPVKEWETYQELIQNNPSRPLRVVWRRDGAVMQATLTPAATADQMTLEKRGESGVMPMMPRRRFTAGQALTQAMKRTLDLIVRTFEIIYKVITRRIPGRAIGGPIFVAKVTYEGASWGAEYFIALWALLSINLFVVNLLPVPVLDGGHIALFAVEAIRRRRLSERENAWIMRIGWALIIMLFVFLIFNDLLRLFNR